MHANSYKSNCLMLTSCAHETSVPVVCESVFPLTFIARWICESHSSGAESHETLNLRSPIHKTASFYRHAKHSCFHLSLLHAAVGLNGAGAMSHGAVKEAENLVSIQPAAAPPPDRARARPVTSARISQSCRDALQTPHTRLGGNEWLDSHFCTIWEPPTGLLMPGWK